MVVSLEEVDSTSAKADLRAPDLMEATQAPQVVEFIPTFEQLRLLVDGVAARDSARDLASRVGVTVEQVLGLVGQFGEWVGLTSGTVRHIPYAYFGPEAPVQNTLLAVASAPATATHVSQGRKLVPINKLDLAKRATLYGLAPGLVELILEAEPAQAAKLMTRYERRWKRRHKDQVIAVPESFGQDALGRNRQRNVARAWATLYTHAPSDAVLTRYLARKHTVAKTVVVTYGALCAICAFARLGRAHELEAVSAQAPFRQMVTEATRLLDVALNDAQRALDVLLAQADEDSDLDQGTIVNATLQAAWLNEAQMRKIQNIAEAGTGELTRRRLRLELRHLGKLVTAQPQLYRVVGAGQLNQGQICRLAQSLGFKTEPDADDRQLIVGIRTELAKRGLDADRDQLIPAAIQAAHNGELEEFLAGLDLRATDPAAWAKMSFAH